MAAALARKTGRGAAKSQHILANQILDIIRDRRMGRGDRLAEISLAEQIGVSRTPIRAALQLLAEEGIVEARRNLGFSVLRGWTDIKSTVLALPPSGDDDLYMRILMNRLAGKVPETITQAALLAYFKVDRVSLIRTLGRMAEEGLVMKNKGHGWTFMPAIDTDVALANSYDFRLMVEPAIYQLKTFRIDIVALDRIRSRHMWLLEQADTLSATGRELFEIDAQFHETLAACSHNSFFIQAIQHQNRLRRLLEYQGYWNLRRIQNWVREHLDIIDAIWANDMKTAEARMRMHLENAYRAAVKLTGSGRGERAGSTAKPISVVEPQPRRRAKQAE